MENNSLAQLKEDIYGYEEQLYNIGQIKLIQKGELIRIIQISFEDNKSSYSLGWASARAGVPQKGQARYLRLKDGREYLTDFYNELPLQQPTKAALTLYAGNTKGVPRK